MFQENGYLTDQGLLERLQRMQAHYIIRPSSIMKQLDDKIILKRDGMWSEVGCEADQFDTYFKIYTGDRERFNWVNDKLEIACGLMDYPFLRMEWDNNEESVAKV